LLFFGVNNVLIILNHCVVRYQSILICTSKGASPANKMCDGGSGGNQTAFFLGQSFSSYEELSRTRKLYESSTSTQLYVMHSRSIQYAKKKLASSNTKKLSETLRYYEVSYACIGGTGSGNKKFKSKATGMRQTSSFRQGCPVEIKLSNSLDGTNLVVTKCNLEHNHLSLKDECDGMEGTPKWEKITPFTQRKRKILQKVKLSDKKDEDEEGLYTSAPSLRDEDDYIQPSSSIVAASLDDEDEEYEDIDAEHEMSIEEELDCSEKSFDGLLHGTPVMPRKKMAIQHKILAAISTVCRDNFIFENSITIKGSFDVVVDLQDVHTVDLDEELWPDDLSLSTEVSDIEDEDTSFDLPWQAQSPSVDTDNQNVITEHIDRNTVTEEDIYPTQDVHVQEDVDSTIEDSALEPIYTSTQEALVDHVQEAKDRTTQEAVLEAIDSHQEESMQDSDVINEIISPEISPEMSSFTHDVTVPVITDTPDTSTVTQDENTQLSEDKLKYSNLIRVVSPYHCTSCSKRFHKRADLALHMTKHLVSKTCICTTCCKGFLNETSLNKHTCDASLNIKKKYQCSVCEKMFKSHFQAIRHMPTHTGEKPHMCDLCGKAYSDESGLRAHNMMHHSDNRPYGCVLCGKAYTTKQSLTVHLRSHTGQKACICSICGKGLSSCNTLREHMENHTGIKSHKCTICPKTYSAKLALKRHMMSHTGERDHQCTHCGKSFFRKTILDNHMRTHTGDKPYPCKICGKKFAQSSQLVRHIGTHRKQGYLTEVGPDDIVNSGLTPSIQYIKQDALQEEDQQILIVYTTDQPGYAEGEQVYDDEEQVTYVESHQQVYNERGHVYDAREQVQLATYENVVEMETQIEPYQGSRQCTPI